MKTVRLIEHEPSWELHFLLRVFGIAYTTDYSPTPFALGRPLPIIVDENGISSGEGCYKYITKQRDFYKSIQGVDELVSAYLQKNLCQVYENYLVVSDTNRNILQRNDAWGVRIQQSFLLEMKSVLFEKSNLLFPDATSEQLHKNLLDTYTYLNQKLKNWDENSILTNWSNNNRTNGDYYGIADALLYGQIMRILMNSEFSSLLKLNKDYENIIKYVEDLNQKYFINYDIHQSIESYWNVSLQVLLNNPYIRYNPDADEIVKAFVEALEHCDLDLNRYYENREIISEDLPTTYKSPFPIPVPSEPEPEPVQPDSTTSTDSSESEEATPTTHSLISTYLKEKKWIFATSFHAAVGVSFLCYFFQTSRL